MCVRKLLTIGVACLLATQGGCRWHQQQMEAKAFDHYAQGRILMDSGDLDSALLALSKAIEANPDLSIAYTTCGDIHRKQRNYYQAVVSYKTACDKNPYAFRPHYNLGVTYQLLAEDAKKPSENQDYQREAANVYLRAVSILPDDFDANLNLSACYFQMGKYELAEEYCKLAIEAQPENPQAHSNLGIIYDSQNRLYEAVAAYKKSLELDTNQPKILLNLGSTYLRQGPNPLGRCKAALRVFKVAAQTDPTDPAPWQQMGVCYYRLKDYAQAIDAYEKSIALSKDSASSYRGLGTVYITRYVLDPNSTHYRDKGIEAWNLSLEIDPTQKDLIQLVRRYAPDQRPPQL